MLRFNSDLPRSVTQCQASVVRDEEADDLVPLTPSTFSLYIVNTVAVLPINPPLPSFVQY